MSRSGCQWTRALAAELALGLLDGEDRAAALEHLAGCPECRAEVERLATVADELPALSPAVEPPTGFEARATEAMIPPRARRRRRLLAPAIAAAVAAAVAALVVWTALGDDRELADSYRATLAVADGEYFDAAGLEAPGGHRIGYVYGYEGRSSWLLAVVYDGVPGSYELEVVTEDGDHLPLRKLVVGTDGVGSVGGLTPIPYNEVAEVRLLDRAGGEAADSETEAR